jgi:DNA-binding GntR family transcriptional regulator
MPVVAKKSRSPKSRPLGTDTLSQRAYAELRRRILDGSYEPGRRLVRRTFAEELHISPIPIIEALYRLELDGLVENEPGVGARVMSWTPARLRNDQIVREALECQAARLCAVNASPAELDQLVLEAKALDRVMSAQDDSELEELEAHPDDAKYAMLGERFRRHMKFHLLIARLGGYSALRQQIELIWLRHATFSKWNPRDAFPGSRRRTAPADWHETLALTIATRDETLAEAKMREHVTFNQQRDIDLILRAQLRAE